MGHLYSRTEWGVFIKTYTANTHANTHANSHAHSYEDTCSHSHAHSYAYTHSYYCRRCGTYNAELPVGNCSMARHRNQCQCIVYLRWNDLNPNQRCKYFWHTDS